MLRDGKNFDYPETELDIGGKKIYKSVIRLRVGDMFVAMSDGCPHAGIGISYNFGWKRENIIDFVETVSVAGYTAKALSTMLVKECFKLYGERPGDDATACIVRMRKREQINLLFGPPSNREDCNKMMSLFFSQEGKHIVCGGTTSAIVSQYLQKPLKTSLDYQDFDIPPIAEIDGVDLVTEGVITIDRVLEYAKDYLGDNKKFFQWSRGRDGASLISRFLFEDATDINLFIGRAINPAHQNPDLPINFNIKMNLAAELAECLEKMGKRIKIRCF